MWSFYVDSIYAFMLIRKTWDDQFTGKGRGMGNLKKWGILVVGGGGGLKA